MCKGNIYAQVGLSYSEPLPLGLSPLSLAPVVVGGPTGHSDVRGKLVTYYIH